ncbi:ABC transporter substrate-binding protein [Jidongwangia harbinensis]|uniref:ABC transporter substrate-binding protein n=1 Tax=Jidongwangia harbinensis TaxID=2878561 RepID=UPI001CDA3FF7|nr:peptide ABC transporter substrate-binding protein [Jidongwangia harbinensis]MCA2218278.1 peptide ABC transporter substrate-binding protein [Jidongwangia harbinensis]
MNRVVIARTAGVTVLHPLRYRDLATGEVVNRVFDHLVLTDSRQRYVPGRLTRSWESSPDGLVWTFRLRERARWHDGRPVTADDAVFTFETIQDPAGGSARRAEFPPDRPVRFTAAGPHVLRAELAAPFAPFLAALAWRPVVARHAPDRPVGSGAFRFAGRTADEVVLAAEPDYHLGRPPLDEVVWRRTAGIDEAVRQVCDGAADYVPGVPPALAARLRDRPDVRLVRSADTSFTYLGFHLDAPPFDDLRVRRAMAAAIDRDALVRDVLGGCGTVAHGPIAPGGPWYHPGIHRHPYDPARAAALLDGAGWRRDSDGVRRRDGRPLAFELRTVAGDRVKEETAAALATQLGRAGVGVRVLTHPMDELLRDHVLPRRFEAILLALVPNPDPDFLRYFYHSQMLTPVGSNRFAYRDDRVDSLLSASQSEIDEVRRKGLVGAALERITRDLPQVFLFHPEVIDATRADLLLPDLPERAANRFMFLHEWDRAAVVRAS